MLEPEKRRISQEVANILEADASAAETAAIAEADIQGLKELFCKHWSQAKKVLEFLSQWVPENWKKIIAKLIKVGDFLHGALCG